MAGLESISSVYTHMDICKQSLLNNDVFNTFKRHPKYTAILEHCSPQIAINAIKELIKRGFIHRLPWDKIRENDTVGSPKLFDFRVYMEEFITLDNYDFSPSTIQYVYQSVDILTDFSEKDDIKNITIVEV